MMHASYMPVQQDSFLAKMLEKNPEKAQETLDYLDRAQRMQSFFAVKSPTLTEGYKSSCGKRSYAQALESTCCYDQKESSLKKRA